jgi:hypothetical protein
MKLALPIIFSIFFVAPAHSRLASSTFNDIKVLLESGQESAAELTSYFFLRNYPKEKQRMDVKFVLAEIYQRQTRFDEMILWLKDLEKDPGLPGEMQPRLAYMLFVAQDKNGDKDAANVQKSLLIRKFPKSEWTKKVSAK